MIEAVKAVIAAAHRSIRITLSPHLRMGLVTLQQKSYAEAIRELQTASRLANHSPRARGRGTPGMR